MTASLDNRNSTLLRFLTKSSLSASLCLSCSLLTVSTAFIAGTASAVPVTNNIRQITATSFVYPVMGSRTSSDFGTRRHPIKKDIRRHHHGVDLAAPKGSIIRSIASGRVIYSDPFGGYGNLIVIKHSNGLTSHYGHCQKRAVQVGQSVNAGDIIGTVGSTGLSTGPHLHFEIRRDGEPQNPERFLPGLDVPAEG
jgi:murein DD-endopeptidase MepM/ murein hydrolase activator NlpD